MLTNNFFFARGYLGKEPDLKYSAAGKPYLIFTIACQRNTKQKNEERPGTDWIGCICFGKVAEEIGLQAQKGSVIAVFGSLQTNSYVDKTGNQHRNIQVLVDQAYVLKNYKVDDDGSTYANVTLPKNPQTPASNTGGYVDELDSEITADDFPFF